MLVAESLCWRLFSLCWWFSQCIKSVTNILNRSPTSQTYHQDIWSPASVTNIDVTFQTTHYRFLCHFLGMLFILELFMWHIFGEDCRLCRPQMCHYDDLINYRKYARKTTIHTFLFSTISVMWVQKSATDPLFVCKDFPVNSFLSYKHNARKDVCMTQKSVQTNRFNINRLSNHCNEKIQ